VISGFVEIINRGLWMSGLRALVNVNDSLDSHYYVKNV